MQNLAQERIVGFWRRFAALIYDTLLVIAIAALAEALLMICLAFILPGWQQNHPDALRRNPLHSVYLLLWCYAYFAWCWHHSGQTVGLKAWSLRVQTQYPGPLSVWQSGTRFITGLFGFGLLLAPFMPRRQSLQDWASGTRVVFVTNPKTIAK